MILKMLLQKILHGKGKSLFLIKKRKHIRGILYTLLMTPLKTTTPTMKYLKIPIKASRKVWCSPDGFIIRLETQNSELSLI